MARRPSARRNRAPENPPFWKAKSLAEMSKAEWESLCDGCGKCCLLKIEYEDTGEIARTDVACRQLDRHSCRCRNYAIRRRLVDDCIQLSPDMVGHLSWLPATCAYRLIDEGRDLYWWHPLVSGDPETVHQAGISVRGRAIGEDEAGDLENHIVDWKD